MGIFKKNGLRAEARKPLILLEPLRGFEPPTRALRMRCSTTELQRRITQKLLYSTYSKMSIAVNRSKGCLSVF